MKPEEGSRRLYSITRAKGRMYEFRLPESSHISIPSDTDPAELLILTVGILGDAVSATPEVDSDAESMIDYPALRFPANYFDALLSSRLTPSLSERLYLLSSAAYLLARLPGSSLVMAAQLEDTDKVSDLHTFACWILRDNWLDQPEFSQSSLGRTLNDLASRLSQHFSDGWEIPDIQALLAEVRRSGATEASPYDQLLSDIISAVSLRRLKSSAWRLLPQYSGVPVEEWSTAIRKTHFPRELWPSQELIGDHGMMAGASGVIQMPTSAGKTRSIEMIIRSRFLAGRSKLAVIVAPFRALSQEIKQSLAHAFAGDGIGVNQFSDALQIDYLAQLEAFLGISSEILPSVIVATPEKLLYVIRQHPELVDHIGLVIYDEGHQFDSGQRGVTYELLLTSIKSRLSEAAQTILISAVVKNAEEISKWLSGDSATVVHGTNLLPTARSTAFTSWREQLGQVMFYDNEVSDRPDYFVPRVIHQQSLSRRPRERKPRVFPERDSPHDISLYLALHLVGEGAAAVFCGTKNTAQAIVKRAVEIYSRNLDVEWPSEYSNQRELAGIASLLQLHFEDDHYLVGGAGRGIFAHHGNTPKGVRLSIEYAVQRGMIKLVVCTSTLAQGVNLPIRYLIVSGVNQGPQRIKNRDFHNLIGRAGRAGFHTEGMVIFADPRTYDSRLSETWRINAARNLLDPKETEPTSSTLLILIQPWKARSGLYIEISPDVLVSLLDLTDDQVTQRAEELANTYSVDAVDIDDLTRELKNRRDAVHAVESHIMQQGDPPGQERMEEYAEELASQTLAYDIAEDHEKAALQAMFSKVARSITATVPDPARRGGYAKTLLGMHQAVHIHEWVEKHGEALIEIREISNLVDEIWDLLIETIDSPFAQTTEPIQVPKEIAKLWCLGEPYKVLVAYSIQEEAIKPWGTSKRAVSEDDIVNFCEHSLGHDLTLGVAAIVQFLNGDSRSQPRDTGPFMRLHKSMKYGVPTELAISCYEFGFSDRMLAQGIENILRSSGYEGNSCQEGLSYAPRAVEQYLGQFPSYFQTLLDNSEY